MPNSFFRSASLCLLLSGLPFAHAAPLKKAGAKAKALAKAPAKSVAKKPAILQGVRVQGSGGATFKASFAKGNSNSLLMPFVAEELDKYKTPISSARATSDQQTTTTVAFLYGPIEEIGEMKRQRSLLLTIFSLRGFRAGQTFSITPMEINRTKSQLCWINYDESEIIDRKTTRASGRTVSKATRKQRVWQAVSGTLRIDSVSEDGLAYTIKNARFAAPKASNTTNTAQGAFLMNASGTSTFDEN